MHTTSTFIFFLTPDSTSTNTCNCQRPLKTWRSLGHPPAVAVSSLCQQHCATTSTSLVFEDIPKRHTPHKDELLPLRGQIPLLSCYIHKPYAVPGLLGTCRQIAGEAGGLC